MFILSDWGVANGAFFSLVSGIYGTVARMYDIILQVSSNSDLQVSLKISDFANTIYVLAGVFMLFRVVIGLLQMLINPDKVTDKQVGAGKLMTRIVTCIVLLWVFYPSGVLLAPYNSKTGEGGLLPRLETAILGTNGDGLIDKILRGKDKIKGNPYDFDKDDKVKTKSCYYLSAKESDNEVKYYKIIFKTGQTNEEGYKEVIDSNGIHYKVVSGYVGGKDSGSDLTYSSIDNDLRYGDDMVTKKGNLKCPKSFNKNGNSYTSSSYPTTDDSLSGGYTSVKQMIEEVENMSEGKGWFIETYAKIRKTKPWKYYITTTVPGWIYNKLEQWQVVKQAEKAGIDISVPLLTDLVYRDSSLSFAQSTATSFQECAGDDKQKCYEVQDEMFGTVNANQEAVKLIDSGELTVDFFFSWVFGIAIIIYLIFLIVDIIVRKFKLVLLEFLVPIPIVSYVDPNDKIFGRWLKMYFSTYVDIFIKLFALNVALILLNADLIPDYDSLLIKILYIVAILVFAKIIPSMISKIFGIDSMGGSFKDILGMGKAALGFGAGAAIGGAVGIATGISAFHATKGQGKGNRALAAAFGVGNGFRSLVAGAGSGSKGNILGGAKQVATSNRDLSSKYNSGLTASNILEAATLGKVGLSHAQQVDKGLVKQQQESKRLEDVNDVKSKISNIATESDFGKYVDNLARNNILDTSEAKNWKDKWTELQIANDAGDELALARFNKDLAEDSRLNYKGKLIEDGKQSQIRQQITRINDIIKGDSNVANVIGNSKIKTYDDVKKANKKANQRKEQIFNDVTAATETSEYRSSKAALEGSGSNNNKS